MQRIALFTILLLLAVAPAMAQEFLVMSVKGKAQCEALSGKKKGQMRDIKVGDVLKGDLRIRTSFASSVTVMAGRGRLLSVDENREVRLSALAKQAAGGKPSDAAGSLLAYAARQLKQNREDGSSGTVYGAVRGADPLFEAVFPRQAVLADVPRFRWVDTDSTGSYSLTLFDDSLRMLRRITVRGQESVLTSVDGAPLAPGHYHWRIQRANDGDQSDIQSFLVASRDTVAFVVRELDGIDRELAAMHADSVIICLTHGLYLERRGLLVDAFAQYDAAARLEPGVAEYRDIARAILLRLRCASSELMLPR